MPLPRKELVDALVSAFDSQTFDRMLSDHLNIRRERLVTTAGAGLDQIVSKVVQIADERGWAIDLIRAALTANPNNPNMAKFIAWNRAYDPANQPAILQSCFLSVLMRSNRVFLRRDEFRDRLQEIGAPMAPRVLAIDGDRFTGKTYSRDFLTYLQENERTWAGVKHVIHYIDMDTGVFEPEDLTRVIGRRLGLNTSQIPPDKGEQASRRIPDLVDWLVVGFEQNKEANFWWLVLDGFRNMKHPAATHDLIRALIEAVEHMDNNKVRLILLNYYNFLDLDTLPYILTETIEPIDVQKDVPQFFRHVYTLSKRSFTDADIDQTVDEVLKQAEAELARRVEDERKKLLDSKLPETKVNEEVVQREKEYRMKVLSTGLTKAAAKLLKT